MKKLFIVALAAFGMVACMNEEITEMPNGGEISFDNAFIDNATRAELTAENLGEFKVWGYIADEEATSQTVTLFEGDKVSNETGAWKYTGGARYWAPGWMHYFEAVAPLTDAVVVNAAEGNAGKIATIDYTVDGESDLIYAAYNKEGNTDGSDNGAVSFGFDHLLSRIMFTFNNGFAADDGISLSVKEVKMTVPAEGQYDVESGEWTVDTNTITTLTDIEGAKFVLPYGDSYAYNIEFKVDVTYKNVVINKDVQKKSTVMVALEKGNSYNFTATIDAESLNMESIEFVVGKVEGWTSTDTEMGVAYVSTVNALQAALNNPAIVKVVATNSLTIAEGENVTLDLNGKTVENPNDYIIENMGNLTINGEGNFQGLGGIRSQGGKITYNGGVYTASSMWQDTKYQHVLKAVNTEVVINDATFDATIGGVTNAMINVSEGATVTINGGKFKNAEGAIPQWPNYLFTYEKDGKLIINDGEFYGGWRFNGETATTDIYGGNFTVGYDGQSFQVGNTHKLTVYGGTFTEIPATGPSSLTSKLNDVVADGYSVVESNGVYSVYAGDGVVGVANAEALQAALDANTETIVLTGDIVGNLNLTQAADAKITILGEGHKFDGYLTMNGSSAQIESAGLTIKDMVFTGEAFSGSDACIRLGNGESDTRYVCNVTVEGCTFDVPGMVGIKSYTGGDKNLVVRNCVATANAHSLIQVANVEDSILVEGCKVYSKNGVNFNQSPNVTIVGCEFDVKGYAVRYGAGSGNTVAAEIYSIKDSTLKSECNDGDAVIILRGTAVDATLTIEDSVIEGTTKIANNVNATVVMLEDGKVKTEADTQDAFNAAVKGDASITLAAGTYTMPSISNNEVTIKGTEDTVITVNAQTNLSGSKVTFDGVTVEFTGNNADYRGLIHVDEVTYNNATLKGQRCLYGNKEIFNNCTFELAKSEYVKVYGAANTEFNNCIFNTAGKAILLYKDGGPFTNTVSVKDCIFNATAGDKASAISNQNCAAIEIHNYGSDIVLTTEGNTVDSNFSGVWRIKKYEDKGYSVTVNGVEYTQTALDGQLMTVTSGVATMD